MAAGKLEWTDADTKKAIEFDKWYHGTAEKEVFDDFDEYMRRIGRNGSTKDA